MVTKHISDDMIRVDKKMCKSCKHSSSHSHGSIDVICNYILDTGHRRGCPVGWCNKYEKGKRKRFPNLSED